MKNVGNFNELKWMPKYTADGTYRGRKKMICGSGATFQVMEFCNGHPVHPHKHDHEQICLIASGVCDFYLEGVKYRMSAGGYMIIPPHAEHYIHVYDSPVPVLNYDIFIPARTEYAQEYEQFLAKEGE